MSKTVILIFVKLGSIRELVGNKPVLKDPISTGPDPVYWVFSEIGNPSTLQQVQGRPEQSRRTTSSGPSGWANVTVIAPGLYTSASLSTGGNGEYPKTFGHYHGVDVNETYHLIEGDGVLQMQKKHIENGQWIKEMVEEVYLIKAKPGDEILITPEWGHSWSNVGKLPLLSFDDWRSGHTPADYEPIEALQGLAYYLVQDPSASSGQGSGQVKPVPNPKYDNLPAPKWITAEKFAKLQK